MDKIYIDNTDVLTTYGVFLIKQKGLLDLLEMKSPTVYDWDDEHGEEVYLEEVILEKRKFTLEVGIKATSIADFKENLHAFYDYMRTVGLRQLRIDNLDKVFMVYLDKAKPFNRMTYWNASLNVGTVTLNFVEPEPVNRQWYGSSTTEKVVTLACTPDNQKYSINWGDGTYETVDESDSPISHTYLVAGSCYIVISGRMDKIDTLSITNVTEVTW